MAVDISESSWKAFVKKHKLEGQLEDKDLLKALARFDKTDERKPEPRLEALADLIKEVPRQVTALVKLKKKLGDKPFGLVKDELYGILDEAEKLQKKTQAALDAEAKEAKDAKAGKDDEGDGEDEPGSALLDPKRLVAQLKMCQRTPDRTVQFAYLDPAAKDQPAVLAMHPKMSSTSIFNKLKKETGGKTGAYGSAWVDGTSLMLQLDKPLGGLVKKVRAAVKAASFRVAKVVLWQADGTVFEQDDEPDKDGDAPGAEVKADAPGAPGAPAGPAAKAIPPAPPGGPAAKAATAAADGGTAFKARMVLLIPKLKEAQVAGHPGAHEAKLKASESGVVAGKRDFVRANALLDDAEALLARPPNSGSPFDEAAFRADWRTAREGWTEAIETVDGQIAKLQAVLRNEPDEDLAAIAEFGLPALTGDFKAPMMAAVMDVDRAGGDGLPRAARRARSLAASFAEYLDEAETVAVTDDNDFGVTVTIRQTIGGALRQIERTLAQAAG